MTAARGNPERWSPTVRRQRLAHVLGSLRDADGRSAAEIAKELGRSESTVTRLENPKHLTLPKPGLIDELLDVYGADAPTRERVRALVDEARQRDWWHRYKAHIPPASATFLGLEAETTVQRMYNPTHVPGILQTPAYAASLVGEQLPKLPNDQLEGFAEERRRWEEHLLVGDDPIRLWVVLGEAALHHQVGSPEVMAEQFDHLHELAQRPNITLAVVPFTCGTHGGLAPFTLLRFGDPLDPEMAYLPDPLGGHWIRDQDAVAALADVFEDLLALHPDKDTNLRVISEAAERFRGKH
jgi:transcriptional regulator with XRE-family HTH domain